MEVFQAWFNSLPGQWVIGPALILHILAAVIWVGGMFFAYQILRPASGDLATPVRIRLWVASLGGFFRWVWLAVILLPTTGTVMAIRAYGHMLQAPWPIHLMLALGTLMIFLFLYVFFGPWRLLRLSLYHSDWPDAELAMKKIRQAVGLNLLLGIATIVLAAAGRTGLLA